MNRAIRNLEIVLPERYAVERVVADNKFMSAMLAHDIETGEPVFAKVRNPATDHLAPLRVANEADISGSLDHRRIPKFRDADPEASHPWIITDFVKVDFVETGGKKVPAVERRLKEVVDPLLAAELMASAAEVLEYIHSQRIVHGDIKPGNLLMTQEETTITDYDVAQRVGEETLNGVPLAIDEVLVTLEYASPEQIRGETALDGRSDIYSLGRVLQFFLSGESPVNHVNANEQTVLCMLADETRTGREVPDGLMEIVEKALQKAPDNRFQSAGEMAERLRRWIRDKTHANGSGSTAQGEVSIVA